MNVYVDCITIKCHKKLTFSERLVVLIYFCNYKLLAVLVHTIVSSTVEPCLPLHILTVCFSSLTVPEAIYISLSFSDIMGC